MKLAQVFVALIALHTVDGRNVEINPSQVTSMQEARENAHNKLFTEGARCMVNLTDGKFVAVKEDCETVTKMIGEK